MYGAIIERILRFQTNCMVKMIRRRKAMERFKIEGVNYKIGALLNSEPGLVSMYKDDR